MMRSMFSGVSGLRAHQTKMDVIGNNVANVNTLGFKSGRVTFQEVFNQTLRGAGAPDATLGRGGTNPMQIGLGTGVGAIDTMMTRGSSQRTDNPTDLSIEGEGFFIVKGSNADTFKFTRAGNFGLDKLGNLVSGSGMNVFGWMEYDYPNNDGVPKFNTEGEIQSINLYTDEFNGYKRIIAPKATTVAKFSGNLNSGYKENESFSVPFTVYDSLGNAHELTVKYTRDAGTETAPNAWKYSITAKSVDENGAPEDDEIGAGSISFTTEGKVVLPEPPSEDPAFPNITFPPVGGAEVLSIAIDFSSVTQYASDCSVKPTNVNGYSTGNLVTFNIGSDGMITGVYSNGQQQPLGLIALASFSNPAGLQKVGDNLFIPTTNSGDFTKAVQVGAEGVGTLSPGTLEMSNVDLSREFTDMIVTQRGFQANSRIITTSDEMLQELVNLKR